MANASELLHFLKQDRDLQPHSEAAQEVLAEAVQAAFDNLVDCMQGELRNTMPAFLDENLNDLEEEGMFSARKSLVLSLLTVQTKCEGKKKSSAK